MSQPYHKRNGYIMGPDRGRVYHDRQEIPTVRFARIG